MMHFDEKSGVVECQTPWGRWHQTVAEVVAEVDVDPGTGSKDVALTIKPRRLSCKVKGRPIFEVRSIAKCVPLFPFTTKKLIPSVFQGELHETVVEDESTWTLEDKKLIRIQLVKAISSSREVCWTSLLKEGADDHPDRCFRPDPVVLAEMRKKLDLEMFQREVPNAGLACLEIVEDRFF